jgi:hypothetical protein
MRVFAAFHSIQFEPGPARSTVGDTGVANEAREKSLAHPPAREYVPVEYAG